MARLTPAIRRTIRTIAHRAMAAMAARFAAPDAAAQTQYTDGIEQIETALDHMNRHTRLARDAAEAFHEENP